VTESQIETLTASHSTLRSQLDTAKRKLSQSEIDLDSQRKLWEQERSSLIERYSAARGALSGEPSRSPEEEAKARSQTIQQLESQVKSLGQQLLRKQDAMQELLSERAALKVRLQDSQRR
jgi:chromosome segregation ATPase